MASIYDWSQTAASNASSDSDITWAEGQAPSTVNNSARQMMARIAELLADMGGAEDATGTANGILVTANSNFTTYANGRVVAFNATSTNTAAVTLNVNGIGAKAIRKMGSSGDAALAAGDIQADGIYVTRYNTTLNGGAGGWQLLNVPTVQLSAANTWTGAQTFTGGLISPYTVPSATDNGYPTGLSHSDVNGIPGMNGVTALTVNASSIREFQISAPLDGSTLYVRAFHTSNPDWSAWSTVWTDRNDGAGSALDADLLDGQHGSYYNDAANLTGTIPNARISGAYSGITDLTISGAYSDTGTAILASTSNSVLLRPNGPGASTGQFVVATSGSVTAGGSATFNGSVTGNGVFADDTVGGTILLRPNGSGSTSGQVTVDSSGNLNTGGSVTGTSFSGSGASLTSLDANNISSGTLAVSRLDSTVWRDGNEPSSAQLEGILGNAYAGFSLTTSSSTTSFPIGQYLNASLTSGSNIRNAATNDIRLGAVSSEFTTAGAGSILSGTWRAKGSDSDTTTMTLVNRTA